MRGNAPAPVDAAINVMELTSRAGELFLVQPVEEKQAFLHLVLKSASWANGELQTEFENPFEALRRSNRLNQTQQKEIEMKVTDKEIWLPGMDSNHELDRILKSHNLLILQSR